MFCHVIIERESFLTQEMINNIRNIRFPSLDSKKFLYRAYRMLPAKLGYSRRTKFHNKSETMIRDAFPDPHGKYTQFIPAA